ncbi:diguanylate cyclase (GGDEF)-like protein [Saccharopolyspora lacisalsi]|uniref:Diguanylate cyclase (GGDEF)-like protein n=1 Tax=Halosaccharopolyspora lacisalsi TaxID=1000566 RepID=A0A839E7G6_9PSEU|nr:tetratricopeptide repeat-containing diguanylate cyclase [Halosaccharopolyspora lacisalsi]MBA8826818.1 diguanylate cyclase (GGDEF)-like protein [Halosaccharopolyspora lacisalsi]
MAGQIPEQDRRVRILLESARFEEANEVFEEVTATATNTVEEGWDRATVLVNRALNAWRLGRVSTALELAAEGWTEIDVDRPTNATTAQTIGMLGSLLETVGHQPSAMDLITRSVHIARASEDPATLAQCLSREANALLFRAVGLEECDERVKRFREARALYEEALPLADSSLIRRSVLASSARALAGTGDAEEAEQRATEALQLSREDEDWLNASIAIWVLAGIRWDEGKLDEARTWASRALEGAERVRDTMLLMRFSRDLASICEELEDPVGEAAALRRTVRASQAAVRTLHEGLGQALEQRRVAVQAQRLATAAQEAAVRDPLTGLTNRRGLERRAPGLLDRTAARGRIPWLVLIDVDQFKDVNDSSGHVVGDVVLQEIAQLLRRESRADDLVCRWAGDEFVVLLVDASEEAKEAGPMVAERIRNAIRDHDWRLALGITDKLPTASIGVAAGPAEFEHLFAAADIALYRAKEAGRNRVETNEGDLTVPPAPRES